jgi:hypothetical protein
VIEGRHYRRRVTRRELAAVRALADADGSWSIASAVLGVNRAALHQRLSGLYRKLAPPLEAERDAGGRWTSTAGAWAIANLAELEALT